MGELLTIEAHGSRYRIENPGGPRIGKALQAGQPYEAEVLEHIYRRQFSGVAIDAGANVGNHTLWLAAVCGLKVYAFEPLHFDTLQRNCALNIDLPIVTFGFGLAESARTGGNAGEGRIRGEGSIELRPLDVMELEDVAVMKIDVEGMESQVLRGSQETIRRCHPVIYAEAWDVDADAHERNASILAPLGYRHTKTFGGRGQPLEEWEPC